MNDIVIKPKLFTLQPIVKNIVLLILLVLVLYYGRVHWSVPPLWYLVAVGAWIAWDLWIRSRAHITVTDSKVDFTKEFPWVNPSVGGVDSLTSIDINEISEIRKSFKFITIREWYLWWTLDLVKLDGKYKSINYDLYKKEDLNKLVGAIVHTNPKIKLDSFASSLLNSHD